MLRFLLLQIVVIYCFSLAANPYSNFSVSRVEKSLDNIFTVIEKHEALISEYGEHKPVPEFFFNQEFLDDVLYKILTILIFYETIFEELGQHMNDDKDIDLLRTVKCLNDISENHLPRLNILLNFYTVIRLHAVQELFDEHVIERETHQYTSSLAKLLIAEVVKMVEALDFIPIYE